MPSTAKPGARHRPGATGWDAFTTTKPLVVTALDGLPEDLGQLMRNVAVTVGHDPGPPGLLGLYQGIPLTSRTSDYAGVLPARITIYHQAICAICRTEDDSPTRSAGLSSTR